MSLGWKLAAAAGESAQPESPPSRQCDGLTPARAPPGWDDGEGFLHPSMYTDWTAVILLLLTAAPLAVVVATAAFFIWRKKQQQG